MSQRDRTRTRLHFRATFPEKKVMISASLLADDGTKAHVPPRRKLLTAVPSAFGLKSVKLLQGVEASALEELAQKCRWRRFKPDQRVISREAADTDVYLIISGRVRITAFS